MKTKYSQLLGCLLLCSLSGCSLPFNLSASPKTNFKLTAQLEQTPSPIHIQKRLGVREILSSGFIDSHKILFSRKRGQLGYYQYATWVELPAKQLTDLLLLSLQRSELFSAVSRTTSGAIFDLQLNAELLEFSHDIEKSPTSVRAILACEIVNLQTRDVVANKIFDLTETVSDNDVEGAVDGFNRISDRLLVDIQRWMSESLNVKTEMGKNPARAVEMNAPGERVPEIGSAELQ